MLFNFFLVSLLFSILLLYNFVTLKQMIQIKVSGTGSEMQMDKK